MNESTWPSKVLWRALCVALIISLLPVLLATVAPAVAIASVALDPRPGRLLATAAPWWLVGMLVSHWWFAAGTAALLVAAPGRRISASTRWRLAAAGLLAVAAYLACDALTSTDAPLRVTGYAWPALILASLVLWLCGRPRPGPAASLP